MAGLPKIEHSEGFLKAMEAAKRKPGLIDFSHTSGLQRSSMTRYLQNNRALAGYVKDLLATSANDSPWIIIIEPEKSGDCYVTSATIKSSDVSSILKSLRPPVST